MSSISDQCYFMQNIVKTHQQVYVFSKIILRSIITHSKSVARCVAIIIIFLIINNCTFLRLNLIKNNTSKRTKLHKSFQNSLGEHAPNPLASL